MIRISEIRQELDSDREDLYKKCAKLLRIKKEQIQSLEIVRRSIDSRKKDDIFFSYTVDVKVDTDEERLLKKINSNKISLAKKYSYVCPENKRTSVLRPVVVGFGPAGIFAALILARAGLKPLVLERGHDVDTRTADVSRFFETKILRIKNH